MKNRKPQPYASVCIPTYEMHGKGPRFLENNFKILADQTFKNFEVVVSDNSKTSVIKNVCSKYKSKLRINYVVNPDVLRGMSANVNNAIRNSQGELVKILFLDDFLKDRNSLQIIVNNFDLNKDKWLVTACEHTSDGKNHFRKHSASYNDNIHLGKNSIGSPSVLTIKNENPLFFDERMKWFMDCDYYKRCFDRFGEPKVINESTVVIRTGDHQVTVNEITDKLKSTELAYVSRKHRRTVIKKLNLDNITLVAVSGIDPEGALTSLRQSMVGVSYYDVVLISHRCPSNLPKEVTFKQCRDDELKSSDPKNKNDYSKFMAYNLGRYINSDFALIVHKNAYVVRPYKWSEEFLKYDYVGAPWLPNVHFTRSGKNVRMGNGGFSLRSKRLMSVLNDLKLPFTDGGTGFFNEDGVICVYHRGKLEKVGIRFAPVDLGARFSLEKRCEESDLSPFGFHDNQLAIPFWYPFRYFLYNNGIDL